MSETVCPVCGESKQRIAQHWAMSDCGSPDLEARQRAVVDGLVLAGGTVAGNGTNLHVTIGTTSETLAQWTATQLDWLCQSVRETEGEGNRELVYRVRTTAHPDLNRYERWSDGAPPERFTLGAGAARVWWAYASGIEWHGPYDSQCVGVFSAKHDERAAWILRVLEDAGYDATRVGKRVQLPGTDLQAWLEWIGDPVPGAEHKWERSRVQYVARRREPETEAQWRVELSRAALETAADRTDLPLTRDVFEDRIDEVDAVEVADAVGGGSFDAAKRVVLGAADRSDSLDDSYDSDYRYEEPPRYTKEELLDAIRAAAADVDGPLTVSAYKRWRSEHLENPTYTTIMNRLGWHSACDMAGVQYEYQQGRGEKWSDQDLLDAVRAADSDLGHEPSVAEYKEWSAGRDDVPSFQSIANRIGWSDAKERALEDD